MAKMVAVSASGETTSGLLGEGTAGRDDFDALGVLDPARGVSAPLLDTLALVSHMGGLTVPDNEIIPLPIGALMDATGLDYQDLAALPRRREGFGPALLEPAILAEVITVGLAALPRCAHCERAFIPRGGRQRFCGALRRAKGERVEPEGVISS